MFALSDGLRREFLAVRHLIRLVLPDNEAHVGLLVKASTLTLKYLVRLKTFVLTVERLAETSYILYAVRVNDDPEHPSTIWSLVETDNELQALNKIIDVGQCNVCLFNEAAVNVSCADTTFNIIKNDATAITSGARFPSGGEWTELRALAHRTLELPMASRFGAIAAQPLVECAWEPVQSRYITNRLEGSVLDLINGDEGDQQEVLAVWLTDSLSLVGAVKNPQIHDEKGPRELSDVLFGYIGGSFLIESKTLSVLERSELPDRKKLKKNVLKNLSKALSQLPGACKNFKRGLKITDKQGREVTLERSQPIHCIVLVPDLSLLDDSDGVGGKFLRAFLQDTACFLHILDPAALLRSVQYAWMLSRNSESGLPPIMTFDGALTMRWEECAKHETPNVDFLMNVQ